MTNSSLPSIPNVSLKEVRYLLWMSLFLSILFISYKLYQHLVFYTTAYDLSIFDYAMYNTLHGQFMRVPFQYDILWKSNVYVFLLFLLPIYSIYQGPETLLIFQALAVSLSIIPLYLFTRKHLDVRLSAGVVLLYLLNRTITQGFLYDFHIEMFEPLLMFTAFLCLANKQYRGFLIALLLCLTIKQDVAFYLIPFGLYLLWVKKDYKAGLSTIGLAGCWFLFCFYYLVPMTVPRGQSSFFRFYRDYGQTIPEIAVYLLTHPLVVLQSFFTKPVCLLYASVLFLPFLDIRSIALSIIPLLPPLLIHDNIHNQLLCYIGIPVVPYLFYGTISALVLLQNRWGARYPRLLPGLVCVMLLINLPGLMEYKLPPIQQPYPVSASRITSTSRWRFCQCAEQLSPPCLPS